MATDFGDDGIDIVLNLEEVLSADVLLAKRATLQGTAAQKEGGGCEMEFQHTNVGCHPQEDVSFGNLQVPKADLEIAMNRRR